MRFLLVFLLASCGIVTGDTGCDLRTDEAVNGYEDRCQQRTGVQGNAIFGGFCELLGGIDVDGGCPDEGKVVGCDITEAGTSGSVIDWYYAPTTREEAIADCGDDGTIVEP